MATIRHKRSTTAGAVPGAGALVEGEIAVNVADGKVFVKRSNGSVTNVTADGHTHTLSSLTGVSISSPSTGQVLKYDGTNWVNDTDATGQSTTVSADPIWDAKGDLAVGTGADQAVRVPLGTNGRVLMADSAQTAGVKWAEVVDITSAQTISGSKVFSNSFTNFQGTIVTRDIQASGSGSGARLFFSTQSTATDGGSIVFGSDNAGVAHATPKGSIKNLGTPSDANDAANKGYVDGQVATKANASHTHGNITNAGAIGSTSGVPIITGASGVLQAGSFGTAAGTFCQGNDSRLSDARTPTAHTHAAADVNSGTFDIARIPTGTTSATVALGDHNHTLASLTGVSITSPSSGQVLKYNGTNWINDTDATGGGGSVTAEDDQIILAMRVFA